MLDPSVLLANLEPVFGDKGFVLDCLILENSVCQPFEKLMWVGGKNS